MRACPAQYDTPSAVLLPQKLKSGVPTEPIGQRHLRAVRLNSEQGSGLTTSVTTGSAANSALSAIRWVRTCGRRGDDAARGTPGAAVRRPRERPSRFILPMTALRETPISLAIWAQESPALK
jgi:hypothetical protein